LKVIGDGKKSLVFEESPLSKWLYTILKSAVSELIVCDPVYISRKKGPKNDYRDALHLAQQLRGSFLEPVFHEDNFFSALRNEVSAYVDLVQDIVRLKNRYKALFRMEAIVTGGKNFYRDQEQIKNLSDPSSVFVAEDFFRRLMIAEESRVVYRKRFEAYAQKNVEIEVLSTIPGIGVTRACAIAAIVCSAARFENKHKFWAYCMLVKHELMSDDQSYGKKRVNGNRVLKEVFMGAAASVLLHGNALKKYYDDALAKGYDHRAAKKTLARKIASIALSVMKRKSKYQEKYLEV
jgi:transposase